MRNTVSQTNPTASLKVTTCEFCGCRAALGFHWFKPFPTPYISGHACNDCSQHLDTLSHAELYDLVTARAVAQALSPDSWIQFKGIDS